LDLNRGARGNKIDFFVHCFFLSKHDIARDARGIARNDISYS
jgi:hypothetical protein